MAVGTGYAEPHPSVRDTTAWALGKIVLNELKLLAPPLVEKMVDVLCGAFKDQPRVVVNACYVSAPLQLQACARSCPHPLTPCRIPLCATQCLNVLSSSLAEIDQHSLLSSRLPNIMKALHEAQAREDYEENNMRDSCWACVGELLKNTVAADLPFVQMMLQHCLTLLGGSIAKPVGSRPVSALQPPSCCLSL